jgi:hypothetical protein
VEIVLGEPIQNPDNVLALGVEGRNKHCLVVSQLEPTFLSAEIVLYISESKQVPGQPDSGRADGSQWSGGNPS